MTTDEIKTLIEGGFDNAEVTVNGDNGMFDTIVVSDDFDGLAAVKRQQKIYATVNQVITNGAIHALTIKAYTQKEWQTASKLRIG